MFGIPLPWLLFGLCITLFGTYRGGYHFGWSDRDKEMQIEIARKNGASPLLMNLHAYHNALITRIYRGMVNKPVQPEPKDRSDSKISS